VEDEITVFIIEDTTGDVARTSDGLQAFKDAVCGEDSPAD
jgi:hypothetical protein